MCPILSNHKKGTFIGHMGNLGTSDLLLHIVKYWHACAGNEEN